MPFARRVVLRGAAQGIAVGTAALLGLWPRTTEVTSSSLEFDLPTAIPAPPTYHVSNGGDDSNDGLSLARPGQPFRRPMMPCQATDPVSCFEEVTPFTVSSTFLSAAR